MLDQVMEFTAGYWIHRVLTSKKLPCWSFANVYLVRIYKHRNSGVKLRRNKMPDTPLENQKVWFWPTWEASLRTLVKVLWDHQLMKASIVLCVRVIIKDCHISLRQQTKHGNGDCCIAAGIGFTFVKADPTDWERQSNDWESLILFQEYGLGGWKKWQVPPFLPLPVIHPSVHKVFWFLT